MRESIRPSCQAAFQVTADECTRWYIWPETRLPHTRPEHPHRHLGCAEVEASSLTVVPSHRALLLFIISCYNKLTQSL